MFGRLILLRHTQSLWNQCNRFTGWIDIPLSAQGIEEAKRLQSSFAKEKFDMVFSSQLMRAQMTACLALCNYPQTPYLIDLDQNPELVSDCRNPYRDFCNQTLEPLPGLPLLCTWHLNERHYGILQGRNKEECLLEYGKEQFVRWRRGFNDAPPGGESLKMTAERTIPFFESTIRPLLEQGKQVLIVAHGNSLRALTMHLKNLTPEEVLTLEIPTGQPIFYSWPL